MEQENIKYKKIENNLEMYLPRKANELKQIAKDLIDGKIFCDRHIPKHDNHLVPSIFMVLALCGQKTIDFMLHYKISFVYEYLDKAGPRAINGYPIFFSIGMLNDKDTAKMFKYYEKLKELRDKEKKELESMELEDD